MMWKEKYKIGVSVIDQQHEELFGRVSSFIQTVQHKGNWDDKLDKVKETMEFMQEYVIFHFDDEEAYQEKIGYPDMEKHKQEHVKFKEAVGKYAVRLEEEGYTEELVQEFSGKLMTWLILHVAATDQKLGEYAQKQGGEQ
ncbi:bacteriohemerythrin [Desulfuribacillus alkaliarsenatis]|uniref:Hemerythrin n=1 Tax=Desulfuribacillus alkaliarsenatis TaxID=766136 RepID=A0A1E5G153_9FIRM|nr:hemerythrin family protein [Desulfuribacillus alkaliarsenatis]OEF96591.1 hemerythrin [Desulfuribacillus alkaliarsenatis]